MLVLLLSAHPSNRAARAEKGYTGLASSLYVTYDHVAKPVYPWYARSRIVGKDVTRPVDARVARTQIYAGLESYL